tara:strand:+ start:340 stop:696 length:357 start_codon:yes stop_codon:yes gene_type:complete
MKVVKLFYRQCLECNGGMSSGYLFSDGDTFCSDKCISKYFGDSKSFTTLEDWNNNGSGLTWKEFQASWEDLDDRSYAYEWQLDLCSYTEWTEGDYEGCVYDLGGKVYEIVEGDGGNKK